MKWNTFHNLGLAQLSVYPPLLLIIFADSTFANSHLYTLAYFGSSA